MRTDPLLNTQREWRARLFEGNGALSWHPGREIAAQLLLYLDQPNTCWDLTTRWLRNVLDADRVDGGWGGYQGPAGAIDYVPVAEHQRPSLGLPSARGLRFSAGSAAIRSVWHSDGLQVTPSVRRSQTMDHGVCEQLLALGTQAKLALPLWCDGKPVGILCADWRHEAPVWQADQCEALVAFTRQALGPLLGSVGTPEEHTPPVRRPTPLTAAERQVARLIVEGLSYKEIAWQLQRSLSTVDHHLRSMRSKCGVQSTARLARWLREHEDLRP